MKVAILGGTGPFGRALAVRLVAAGDDVVIGSRDEERAREIAAAVGCRGARNDAALEGAELVVLAVNADVAVETARGLLGSFRAPVLSVASALEFVSGAARPASGERSLAEEIAALVDVPVVAGLHSLGAHKLARERPDEDTLVCGDDPDAKALALDLAGRVVAGRALDAGPLAAARALEGMTAVLVNVNRHYKTHAGLKVTGLGH
jgi:NADPH-dependent F420 reductase